MATFSITLDDVDLAFLPLRTHKYDDFLKKEHFQFQVMKTETVEDPVPTVYYTCHVCAVEVPVSFASEHVASIKHRANVRIASVAMQRTHKLIASLPPPFSDIIHPPSERFCKNCVIIADEDHDMTKEHLVAAMHDNLLWELMKAYVGELGDEESKNDYKENMKTENQGVNRIGDDKKNYIGFENDRNTANVVSVLNKDPQSSFLESTHNNHRTSDKDKIKIIDSNLDIFVNDHSNKSNPVADAALTKKTAKKQKKEKTENKLPKHETVGVVSNRETVISKNLEKHNKDEEFSKLETKIHNAATTKQTESNTGINKDILDTPKNQDVIKNKGDRKSLKEVGKIETEERSSKHDENSREKEAPAKITDEITKKTYANEPSHIVTNEITTREHIAEIFKIRSPYEMELARTCNNTKAEFREVKNQIYIKTYEAVLIVKKDNFHSYDRKYGHNEIKCIVCDLVFKDKFERLHTHDMYHRRRVSNIGEDDNYVRRVNNMYSHCILCNIKIDYTILAMHKQDCYHLTRKKTHIFTIVSGLTQQEPFTVTTEKDNGIKYKPNDNIIDSNIEYPYEAVFGEIRCVICDCRVPRDLQNRIDHTNGSKHAKNMEKLKTSVPLRSSQEPFPWYF